MHVASVHSSPALLEAKTKCCNLYQFLTAKDSYLQAIHQKSQLEQLSRQHGCVNKDENGLGREEMSLASETMSSACRHASTKNGLKRGQEKMG